MRVTFDTNVLDYACRPERFPKDPRQPNLSKVRDALSAGALNGFYSVTMLTIEGIMRKDRAEVFSSTRISTQETTSITKNADLPPAIRDWVGNQDVETVGLTLTVEQPVRKSLHPEVIARMTAAKNLGVKILRDVPRIGAYAYEDPKNEYYLDNGDGADLDAWLNKIDEVSRSIEARGVGIAQVKALGYSIADPAETWFNALDNTTDIHEQRAIERAFSEWADADSIAAHIAYGLDVFCSNDVGNSNVKNSVLDDANRAWLTSKYGVKFMSFDELLASLP